MIVTLVSNNHFVTHAFADVPENAEKNIFRKLRISLSYDLSLGNNKKGMKNGFCKMDMSKSAGWSVELPKRRNFL